MRKDIKKNNLKGFSLFEVLVTISILMLLSLVVFPVAINRTQENRLESYASQLVTDIYFQQQRSYLRNSPGGVSLGVNTYTLFDGDSLDVASDTDLKTYPSNIRITSISMSGSNEITFLSGEFKPVSYGTFVLTNGMHNFRIYINREGLVGYEKL